jgi:RHS repeat-associated protein
VNAARKSFDRTAPGFVDVRGSALATADVAVNDALATRKGAAFHRAVPVDNSAAAQHPQIKIQALEPNIGPAGADLKAQQTGRVYVPKTPEVHTHDFDGNLTADGRWTYTWTHENRLKAMETVAAAPATAKRRLEFTYDSQGRRFQKKVFSWNGTAWVLSEDRRFLYDGWNLVAEYVIGTPGFTRTYTWGLDVSGTEQGAGGVGGLLMVQQGGAMHFPCSDGNGNVLALVRKSDGARSARYEYGPFGELLEVEESGVSNPFRFSTKFTDGETGLVYYGYRYYSPEMGRWLNRDPIEEQGGWNLYGFVGNDGVGKVDYLGLAYFSYRPLDGVLKIFGVDGNSFDEAMNTMIGHEQLFFEDGGSPSNIGFFSDTTLQSESNLSGYETPHDVGWNDCIMRKAVENVPLQKYCLLGKPGATEKFNCQDWSDAVRAEYRKLARETETYCECYPTDEELKK